MSNKICTVCGRIDQPERRKRGSFALEIILWLCYIVPGLIYTVWRLSTKYDACSSCGATSLVELNSPVGQKLKRDLGSEIPKEKHRSFQLSK